MNNNYNKYFTETENGLDIEANNINANCITSRNNKFSMDTDGNLACNSITTVIKNQSNINFDSIYPIGSIYMSINDVNPDTLFEGTTWEKIVDKFLIGAGGAYPLNSEGGEAEHVLTLEEMPEHNHRLPDRMMVWDSNQKGASSYITHSGVMQYYDFDTLRTTYSGSSKAHNNMPPYLAVYMWKRVS